MKRFYIRYTPIRMGLTGMEYLPQYIDQYFPGISYTSIFSDGLVNYGYIEGTGDLFSKMIQNCSVKFSIKKFDEDVFIGYCYTIFNSNNQSIEFEEESPSFSDIMNNHGINTNNYDLIDCVKKSKKEEFKEIVKKEFYEWNDAIADVSKASLLYLYDDSELSPEQLTKKNELLDRVKQIYTIDVCLDGTENLVKLLETVLYPYYISRMEVDSKEEIEDILNVVYK